MSLTLLVENNPRIESFYVLNLATWLGLEILAKKKAEFAIKHLETKADEIKLIVVRSVIEKEQSARSIIEYVKEKDLKIPVIVIGPAQDLPPCFSHIPNSLQLKPLIQAAARALNITAKDMSNKIVPDFFPIPILYFNVIKRSVCPVFAQDIDDHNKYHLQVDKLVEFDEKLVKGMVEQGITHLYIDKLDRLDFVNNVTSELITLLENGDLSPDEEISASEKNMELLSKKLLTIGVNEETIKLAKKNIDDMRRNTKSNPKMAKLLERLLSNKTSYLFKHTQILTYICLHIIKHIDWGNAEQEDKISFIAFFHDIVLETDQQAMIKSNMELKKANFSAAERQLVERHAQLSAEFVSKYPHAPMGADQIIRQHHGMLNGIGFSEHYGNNVSPVAVVFIVAEEFTRIILNHENGPFDRTEMLRELKDQFPTSRFQKIIDILQKVTF